MELGLSVYTELLYWGKKQRNVFFDRSAHMFVYISMCVSECVDGGGDREYEVKKKYSVNNS